MIWYFLAGLGAGFAALGAWLAHRANSPSRAALRYGQSALDAVVQAMEQAQAQQERRYQESTGELQVVAGRPGLAGCPVCGKSWRETGVSHRFEIKDDVRRCWTP